MAPNTARACMAVSFGVIIVILNLSSGLGNKFEIRSKFVQAEEWNEPCTGNDTCTALAKNSYCELLPETPGVCQCLPDHLQYFSTEADCEANEGDPTPEGRISCLPYAFKPGDICHLDEQCTTRYLGNYSSCVDGTCQCFENATYILEGVRGAEGLRGLQTVPFCNLVAKELGGECLFEIEHDDLPLGYIELYSPECKNIPHSWCGWPGNKCECHPDVPAVMSHSVPKRCVVATEIIGGACAEDAAQCNLVNNTKCDEKSKTCLCEDNFVPNERRTACVERISVLNENCSESAQCTVANSWCQWDAVGTNLTTCECQAEFVQFNPTTCLPIRREINQPCDDIIQCTTGIGFYSECKETSCQCTEKAIYYNHQCHPIVQFGEACLTHDQCNTTSSVISGGAKLSCSLDRMDDNNGTIYTCKCPAATHKEYEGYCYEITGYGKPCQSTKQCMASSGPEGNVCHAGNNTCGCSPEFVVNEDKTGCILESLSLGEGCQESKQCSKSNKVHYCNFETGKCDIFTSKSSALKLNANAVYAVLLVFFSKFV